MVSVHMDAWGCGIMVIHVLVLQYVYYIIISYRIIVNTV
jgi:hypothetical protein